ncbi:hypothetical protein E4T44_09621 [Aureobasidium sp. EXF-8845]|nr:hypothetical protein E4T44_09621 [Aureobasidium sp. EXF-8845]KAI4840568.1 hypothetical protein E4T45_09546 [Aureobasidium sp. EXF-8846]
MATSKKSKRPAEEPATPSEGHVNRPKKKQCRKPTCVVCGTKKYFNQFPGQAKVNSHEHGANVCRSCYVSHLKVEIDSKTWDEVACPECPVRLTYNEVENMADPEDFAKYERASIRATLAADPDFRFCFSSACDSGQLHPGGTSEPIFSCQACRHKHCVVCETNWHDDQTCEEYQATLHRNTETDEQSQREVDKCSKPCPQCRVPIQKNSGCDHMTCKMCRHQFCWVCAAPYMDIANRGNHHHEKSCTHYRADPTSPEAQRLRAQEIQRQAEEARRRRKAHVAATAASAARAAPPTPARVPTTPTAGSSARTPARPTAAAASSPTPAPDSTTQQ